MSLIAYFQFSPFFFTKKHNQATYKIIHQMNPIKLVSLFLFISIEPYSLISAFTKHLLFNKNKNSIISLFSFVFCSLKMPHISIWNWNNCPLSKWNFDLHGVCLFHSLKFHTNSKQKVCGLLKIFGFSYR